MVKGIVTSTLFFLGSLALGETSYHVMKAFKKLCGDVPVARK